MSQVMAAISVDASGPSITVACGSAARMTSAFDATPITDTLNFLACSINACGFVPAAVMATTRNVAGFASTISKA